MSDRIGGIVLCGGQSTRMGQPKEWLRIGEEYTLSRVVRCVGEVCRPVVVAARLGQALPPLPLGASVVHDEFADAGPLAGLLAGLDALIQHADAAFVVPCDHIHVRPAFIQRLVDELGESPGVVVRSEGQLFPLIGVYRLGLIPLLRRMLERREGAAWKFAMEAGARVIDATELADVDPEGESLQNINRPSDL